MLFIATECAICRHFGKQAFQRDARAAGNAEGTRDFTFSGFSLRRTEKIENLLLAWQAAIGGGLRCARFAGHLLASWFLFQALAFASFLAEPGDDVAFLAGVAVARFADFDGAEDDVVEPLFDDFAAVALVVFGLGAALAFFDFLPPPLATRSARSATASSIVNAAASFDFGTVALTLSCVT